eukprot:scaffold16358_cov54-Attheya_sp.AAC.4
MAQQRSLYLLYDDVLNNLTEATVALIRVTLLVVGAHWSRMETGAPQDEASPASQETEAQDGGKETKPIRKRRRIKRVLPLTDEEVRQAEGFGTDNNDDDKMSAEWKILVENDETDWLRSYLKLVLDFNAHYQRGKPRLWHFGPRSWWWKQQKSLATGPPSTTGPSNVNTVATFFEQLRDMRFFYHDKIPLQPKTKSGQIVRAKLKLLDNIGFPWDIQADLDFAANSNGASGDGREDEELDSAQQEWANYHKELQMYLQTRGDTMVPSHTELGIWCVQQRLRHSNGKIGKEQTEALAVLGFRFSMTREVDWNEMYNELKAFQEEWKHTCVWPPETLAHINTSPYASLARWCQRQRVEYKFFQETQNRQATMEASKGQPQEETKTQDDEDKKKARDKSKKGKLKVRNCVLYEGPVTSMLTQELIDKLDALEFIWDTSLELNWCLLYRQLQEFYKENGHSNPKLAKKKGALGDEMPRWIINTRVRNKSEMEKAENIKLVTITPLKKKLLGLVEFSWHVPYSAHISWEKRYDMLLEFRAKEGNCLVPQLHPTLGEWVKKQRAAYDRTMRGGKSERQLTPDMIAKLEAIGFVWRLRHTSRGKYNQGTTGSGVGTTTKKKTTASSASKRKRAAASSTLAKRRKAARKAEILEASSNEDDEDSEGNEESESEEEEEEDEQEEADAFYAGSHDDEEEEDNDVQQKRPADGNKLGPQQTLARQNMLAEMKCGLCSGIMVGATACSPCGHSFCETCLVLQLGRSNRNRNNCTRCGSAIHDTVCQRHMDSIIYFAVEGGEFTPEEAALEEAFILIASGKNL